MRESLDSPEVRGPYQSACRTCPWRVECQDAKWVRTDPDAVRMPMFYKEEGRRWLWQDAGDTGQGARDGWRVMCHRNVGRTPGGGRVLADRWCAGGDALQARAVLRFFDGGATEAALGPLSSMDAVRRIVAEMLTAREEEITEDWVLLRTPITYDELVEAAPADVLNPDVAYGDLVPAPTAEEIARWSASRR